MNIRNLNDATKYEKPKKPVDQSLLTLPLNNKPVTLLVKQEVEPSILQDIIKPACEKFAKQYKSTFKKEFEQDGLLKTEEIAEGKNSK